MNWDELVAGALVGTARRPPALPAAGGAPGEVLAGLDPADAEGLVLAAGVVLGLYRQAGMRLPVDAGPAPAVSPPEARPSCSEVAAERLDSILHGRFRPVLAEWLDLLAAADRLVPPYGLPGLLDAASFNPALRAATVAVIGERGRWLARQRAAWAWAGGGGAVPDDAGTWSTGSAAARRLLLARVRAAEPGAARDLLSSTWSTETPEDRAAFVAALATGLSMDDEPFLEGALDDRRKEVRQAAAGLLWRLPESRLAARMAERSRPLVRITAKRVETVLPEQIDPTMLRDGVVAKPPAGMGQRAWWFFQLVAATPLPTWGDPRAIVDRADPLLRQAWAATAVRQRDETWALALLGADDPDLGELDELGLLGAVPHDRAVAVAIDRVSRLGLPPTVLELLRNCPRPWGAALSRAVVDRIAVVVERQGRPDAGAIALREQLPSLAVRLDPSVVAHAATELADATGWWSDVVSWSLDLLTFRADMREELST